MEQLLKYTYLLDVDKIEQELNNLWQRFQFILDNPNWEDLNEARAILYLTGNFYCETIVPEAIEKRLNFLNEKMSLIDFLSLVDSESPALLEYRNDSSFCKLEKFYLAVKKYKNKAVGGKYYLGEERFIELYNQYNPAKDLKMGFRGKTERD